MSTPARPAAPLVPIADAITAVDNELLGLIKKSLKIRTRSHSSFKEKVTGNAYQSVRLRDEILPGFRESDEGIYVGMRIEGQTIVDMGCNLGERTRIAVRAGAKFAEGIEYEELFVRIGALISAYNRLHRILLRQGDITQPGCLTQDYDIGACFSAFVYVRENLEEILSRIKRLFILETHALDKGWFANNIGPVSKIMPHWMIYDLTDHGVSLAEGKRACIAFGRDIATVRGIPTIRARSLSARNRNIALLDLNESSRIAEMFGEPARGSRPVFKKLRAALSDTETPTEESIAAHLREAVAELQAISAPEPEEGFARDRYWMELFLGLIQRIEQGYVTVENDYLQYLRYLSISGKYDSAMQPILADKTSAIRRVTLRLNAILNILLIRSAAEEPPVVFNAMSVEAAEANGISGNHLAAPFLITDSKGHQYLAPVIDGYHRLGGQYLVGVSMAPCIFVWTNLHQLQLRKGTVPLVKGEKPILVSWTEPAVGSTVEQTMELLFM